MHAVSAAAYRTFYGLPVRWRRRLARFGKRTYLVGALVMVRAADVAPPGLLLLVRQPPGTGWSLPGGLLNRAEPPATAAARELAEETGIELTGEHLRPAHPNAIVHTGARYIDLVFQTEVPADVALAVDHAEILEAGWHPVDNLPPLTAPTARLLARYGIGPYAEYPEVTA